MTLERRRTFDYVIIGAGSAGCVLANRLSADPRLSRRASIEAGGNDDWIWFHIPAGYLFAIGNPRADWMFRTEPDPGLNGRSIAYPRGKVIGGSSAINAMIYMRGQAADYDHWRQMGLTGWGWDDVLPYFMKPEDHFAGRERISRRGRRMARRPSTHALGHPGRVRAKPRARPAFRPTEDFNRGDNAGCGYFQVNQKNGRRWSAARGFLKPALKRQNLKLISNALVDRVSVRWAKGQRGVASFGMACEKSIRDGARSFLSAGAVATPPLLERSGIGDGESACARLGVPLHPAFAWRGRESAGPSAAPLHLQDQRRAHHERGVPLAREARA